MKLYYDTYKLEVPEWTIIVTGKCHSSGKSLGKFTTVVFNPHGDIVSTSNSSGYDNYDAKQFAHKELADILRERERHE